MADKPLQAAALFAGIPDITGNASGITYGRTIEVQEGVPIDGTNSSLRTYSPFLIRVVLPSILGGDNTTLMETHLAPERNPATLTASTVRTDNRDPVSYTQAMGPGPGDSSGLDAYRKMVSQGNALPGLTEASVFSLEDAYNQAIFQQQFGPAQRNINAHPNNTEVPAITNDTSALSLAVQLKRLSVVPPLLMLINPSTMSVTHTKIAQFQSRNRYGYIYEAWGEELPKISFTFKIGAFTAGYAHPNQTGVVSGVQRASRNDSASFQQLQNMLAMFHGGTYLQDTTQNSRAFPLIGNLAIEYDQMVYVGHMESFNFSDEEAHPQGGLDISIDFVANKVYDVAPQTGEILPMQGPNVPNDNQRSFLSRSGTGNSLSLFSAPGIGGTSSLAAPANAWVEDQGIATGQPTGWNEQGQYAVLTSRRR